MANEIGTAYLIVQPQLDTGFEGQLAEQVGQVGDIPVFIIPEVDQGQIESGIDESIDSSEPAITAKAIALGNLIATGIEEGLSAALDIAGALPDLGLQFAKASNILRVGTGAVNEDLEGMKDLVNEIYANSPAQLEDIADSMSLVRVRTGLAGLELGNITNQIVRLSRITGTDLPQLTDDVTAMFNQWNIGAADQEGSLDKLLRVSQKTGIGITDLTGQLNGQGLQLRALGFDYEDSIALIGNLNKSGLDLSVTTAAFRKALTLAAKEGKPANDVFRDIFERIRDAPDDTSAATVAVENFGARGVQMATAIREGRFAWEDLSDSLGEGDTIRNAAADVGTFASKFEVLKHKAEIALEPIASGLADVLLNIGSFAGEVWTTFQREGWDAAWDKIADKADVIWNGDGEHEGIKQKLGRFLEGIPGWIAETIPKVITWFGGLLEGAVSWASNIWEGDPATGQEGLKVKFNAALDNVPGWVLEKINQVGEWFGGLLSGAIDWASNIWEGDPETGQEGLHAKLEHAMDAIPGWIDERRAILLTQVKAFIPKFNEWADKLWDGDPETGEEGLHTKLDRAFDNLGTYIEQKGPWLYIQGQYILSQIWLGMAAFSGLMALWALSLVYHLGKAILSISISLSALGIRIGLYILEGLASVISKYLIGFLKKSLGPLYGVLKLAVPGFTALEKAAPGPTEDHDEGGMIGAPLGKPKLVIAHGGERVLTPEENRRWEGYELGTMTTAAAGGMSVNIGRIVGPEPVRTARETVLAIREERWLNS